MPNNHRWEARVGRRGGLTLSLHWPESESGQGWKGSASCKCSHLISQLTKYYSLAHKKQSAKLAGVLKLKEL